MYKIRLLLILLSCSLCSFGQENEDSHLLEADSTWGKEIIQIPFWFAPDIDFTGYEDIRFAKGWSDPNSMGFWTYAFAWDINLTKKPTATFFEDNLKLYFDGLMRVVNEDSSLTIPKTVSSFLEKERKKGVTTFTGTVEIYDAFTTKKMILLHVTIECAFCKKTKRFIPLFRFSPKDVEHQAWEMLNQVRLRPTDCTNKPKDFQKK